MAFAARTFGSGAYSAPGQTVGVLACSLRGAWQEATNAYKRVLIYADTLLNFGYTQQFSRISAPYQGGGRVMKRVVVDHFGGPEVVSVVEEDDPRPGPGEVRVRVLAAGVSLSDAQLRAGTYLGGPKPPFTPGYELVGVVEELGPGCSRLRVGDRIGALTVWGADAERVCVPEAYAVEVPEDLDPARGPEPRLHLHDRLPAASPHGEGEERGDGARARRGRQGGHRGPRARSGWPDFASTGRLRLATAPRSSGSARWRSTTATRTSWRGCAS